MTCYEIGTLLMSFATLVVTSIGAYFVLKELNQNKKSVKLTNSIKIINDYKNLLHDHISFVGNALSKVNNFNKIIEEINWSKISNFTEEELFEQTKAPEIKKRIEEINLQIRENKELSKNFKISVLESYVESFALDEQAMLIFGEILSELKGIKKPQDKKEKKNKQDVAIDYLKIYYEITALKKFSRSISYIANTFEEFAMEINSGIVDDEVLYKSMHQGFLKTAKKLYVIISFKNTKNSSDAFFQNLSELFVKWEERHRKQKEEFEEIDKKSKDEKRKLTKIKNKF